VIRRNLTAAAAAVAAAALLAGCGGGGGGGDAQGDIPPPSAALPVATGVGADQSASQAIAALGAPGGVAVDEVGATLAGYDSFGTPHDAFAQQVDPNASADGATTDAPTIPADTPINGDPLIAVPDPAAGGAGAGGANGGPTTTDPGAGAPIQNPLSLEADFDVSGEPVVAREGDAIPPDTQQFVVKTVSATSVVLELSGGLLPDGSSTVTLDEGESITLYNATAKRSYRIKLVDVRRV